MPKYEGVSVWLTAHTASLGCFQRPLAISLPWAATTCWGRLAAPLDTLHCMCSISWGFVEVRHKPPFPLYSHPKAFKYHPWYSPASVHRTIESFWLEKIFMFPSSQAGWLCLPSCCHLFTLELWWQLADFSLGTWLSHLIQVFSSRDAAEPGASFPICFLCSCSLLPALQLWLPSQRSQWNPCFSGVYYKEWQNPLWGSSLANT